MSQVFTWGGQSTGVSALASVLPMNTQDWSPSGWTGWISGHSKGLSRVFSNTTVQKHQFFGAQLSTESNSHIHTWPLEKLWPWLDGPLLKSNSSVFQYAVYFGHNFPSKEKASFNFMAVVTICVSSVQSLSHVWLCVTPLTAAHQAPPSPGFSRQEYWSGLPFSSPMHDKIKSATVFTVSPSICHEVMGPDTMILVFWVLSLHFHIYLIS